MSHGNGHWTGRKERGFHVSIWVSLQISMSQLSFPFWYADLNAGSGWNEVRGCEGSPLVFLKCVREFGRSYHAFFCDHNAEALEQLHQRIAALPPDSLGTIQIAHMDNANFLPLFAQRIREKENSRWDRHPAATARPLPGRARISIPRTCPKVCRPGGLAVNVPGAAGPVGCPRRTVVERLRSADLLEEQ